MTVEALIEIVEDAAVARFGSDPPVTVTSAASVSEGVLLARVDFTDADGEEWAQPIAVSVEEVKKNHPLAVIVMAELRSRVVMNSIGDQLDL